MILLEREIKFDLNNPAVDLTVCRRSGRSWITTFEKKVTETGSVSV